MCVCVRVPYRVDSKIFLANKIFDPFLIYKILYFSHVLQKQKHLLANICAEIRNLFCFILNPLSEPKVFTL